VDLIPMVVYMMKMELNAIGGQTMLQKNTRKNKNVSLINILRFPLMEATLAVIKQSMKTLLTMLDYSVNSHLRFLSLTT
jgi:hypothetical protein